MREYQVLIQQDRAIFGHLIIWFSLLFFIVAGIWANYAMLDEVTRGVGKVIPSTHVQVVQNLEGGIVSELLVKAGDVVDQGQILLRIDDTRFASSFRESQVKAQGLQAKIARLTAESQGVAFQIPKDLPAEQRDVFQNEFSLAQSRQKEVQATLNILQQQKNQKQHEIGELRSKVGQLQRSYELVLKELRLTEPLVKKGLASEVELLRLQRQVSELKGGLDGTRLSIPRAESSVSETERKMEELGVNFRTNAISELNDNKAELSRITQSNFALEDRVTRTAVRSPVRGTIKQVKVTTVGGVVQPGMDLIEIVPLEDKLLIEAQIRPADIAFLHPNQPAMVKLTAYDFSIFGGLPAHLEHISADSITNERGESFFLIRVRTERKYLGAEDKPLPIMSGMTASVDILTGKKSLLDYLLKPIKKAHDQALRER
ncbi:MAG: HlyD family type I secretion periplasmic adaptor subunit [Thiotrichaceae bacterium]|nr:HlyD family type I secretion periplasmic adaptor subunit [Thiotrichaceae bacterium]